jgi:hypothetical protein
MWTPKYWPLLVVISIVSVVGSLVLAFLPWPFWDSAAPNNPSTISRAIILGLWTIVPPLWFLAEYGIFFKSSNPTDFERLKYFQDLASKLWAGMLATLTILYFGKDILHK